MRRFSFRAVLIAGTVVRLIISPFLAHPFDIFSLFEVAQRVIGNPGAIAAYLRPYSYSYFLFLFPMLPVIVFVSAHVGATSIPMSSLNPALNPGPQWGVTVVPGLVFDLLVKIPLIVSDLFVAIVIHKLVRSLGGGEFAATYAAALWFLNPFVIWISAAWGMFDTLPALFTMLALLLVAQRRFALASVALAVAVALKYYALVLAFPLLILAWKSGGRKEITGAGIVLLMSVAILFLPSLGASGSALVQLVSAPPLSFGYYSGLSFWTLATLFSQYNTSFLSSASVSVSLLLVYLLVWTRRDTASMAKTPSFFALPLLPVLLFYSFVGENFLIWLMPFIALVASEDGVTRRLYWALSAVGLFASVTDSLLPYYFLPMAPWVGGSLVSMLQIADPYRVAPSGALVSGVTVGKEVLASLSLASSCLIVGILLRLRRRLSQSGTSSPIPGLEKAIQRSGKGGPAWGLLTQVSYGRDERTPQHDSKV